jgi:tight adherence protein B
MVTALLGAGLAVLLWPGGGVDRRARIRRLAFDRPTRTPVRRAVQQAVPVPAVVAAAAVAVGAILSTPLVAVLAGVLAGLAGRAWERRRLDASGAQRQAALVAGLAALGADLRSGRSVAEATQAAASACGDESTGRALIRAVRVPDQPGEPGPLRGPLARLSGAVLLSGRTGCSLAEVVSSVEDDLRARHRSELELRSATTGPRAGARLLAGLPVLGLMMGSGVGADPWRVLTATGTGQVLLVAGVALELAGVAWSSRLVQRAVR